MFRKTRKCFEFATLFFLLSFFLSACGEFKQSEPETFYSETTPPKIQEFRWSNGIMPKSFDPAKVSAPPETDIVRAVYEGLTDTDPKSLEAVPAIATSWSSADNTRIWTFKLRKDAVWSNGEKVTASDFVRSWKRLVSMGDENPHHFMLHNFSGLHSTDIKAKPVKTAAPPVVESKKSEPAGSPHRKGNTAPPSPAPAKKKIRKIATEKFGVEAVNEFELRVVLVQPDEELPKLVAHPMFRPVYGSGDYFEKDPIGADIVTNGAFRIASVGKDGVTLDREQKYFDRDKIKLERVRFVPSQDADAALAAYKSGEVDVVTNTSFEPLVLKLLAPFIDFRTTTHSALNFYEFNTAHAPFNDRRVREALAITIDRKQLTEDEMEGAAKPAFDFLPFDVGRETKIGNDPEKAKRLLETAGFPDAEGFPKIRLLINRNNVQELIARSIAEMWKSSLNIDTEIIVKDSKELAELRDAGEFDIVRRGVVLPTSDETANMLAIFAADKPGSDLQQDKTKQSQANAPADSNSENSMSNAETDAGISNSVSEELLIDTGAEKEAILTEAEAIASIPAIPLYFPTSYSLVKPYVLGFEMNTLDAPSLKNVSIDNSWQPGSKGKQSEKNIR